VKQKWSFFEVLRYFQEKLMLNLDKEWEPWLLDIVPNLPKKDLVINDLKKILGRVFQESKK
jgi:hypothetical protein